MSQRVTQAIKQASAKAGVDFAYLVNNASQESGLNPTAKAKTGTATGLFQFVEQTWLRMVKNYGDKYGLSAAADNITIGSDGVARVKDQQTKQAILALRKDPQASACMAAELTNENKEALECKTGGKVGSTELYLAHFLGAGGAADFISTMRANPNAKAADVLPEAAASNQGVFYDKSGQPQTLAQVYQKFAQKFSHTQDVAAGPTQLASAAPPSAISAYDLPLLHLPSVTGASTYASSPFSASSVMNAYKPDAGMSSPFAAMMLAQMDVDGLTSAHASASTNANDDEQKKKSAISVLGMAG